MKDKFHLICTFWLKQQAVIRLAGLRLTFLLVLPLVVFFSGYVAAELTSDSLTNEQSAAGSLGLLAWPMLPGENLNQLAALFYPGNKSMQRRFVAKTLELNRESNPDLEGATIFQQPATLFIPELKALSRQVSTHKPQPGKTKKQKSTKLKPASTSSPAAIDSTTAETQAMYDAVSAQNLELNNQIQALNEKLAHLQKASENLEAEIKVSLERAKQAELAPVKPAQIKPKAEQTKPVQKSKVDKNQKPQLALLAKARDLLIPLAVIGLLLVLVCWLRRRMSKKPKDTKSNLKNSREDEEFLHNSALALATTDLGTTKMELPSIPVQSTSSVQIIESVVEEAKVLVSMDKADQAIAVLESHIQVLPKASISSWLYLFDIYRNEGKKDEFLSLAKRFNHIFNVMVPQWSPSEAPLVVAKSLEEFPHLVSKLISTWGSGQAKGFLENLLEDSRSGERTGFSQEVAEEIVLLLDVWEARE